MKKAPVKNIVFNICLYFLTFFAYAQTENTEKDGAVLFRFKFKEGDSYKIHSVVDEKVFTDDILHHEAHIVNRIKADVLKAHPSENNRPASGLFSCTFMTSEKNSNKTFSWSRRYPSKFIRDEFGSYTIADEYFMPVVRNIPLFPEKALKPGDTWMGKGHEAHDFRDAFGIKKPFTVPFNVEYQYIGQKEIDGKQYEHITAKYMLDYTVPKEILRKHNGITDVPVKTIGVSNQNLYWDNEKGKLLKYDEKFNIKLVLYSGHTLTFTGDAYAEVIDTKKIEKNTEETLKKTIEDSNLENTKVKRTQEGLTLSIEKIQFLPNSSILRDSEKEKLKKIAAILSQFSDKEFLISGHTALDGTRKEREALSEERASAVANYLIELGLQTREHIYTKGFGGSHPVAPNTSEENRSKNRRVEITILDD